MNNAIMLPGSDVKKCRDHIINEANGMPAESFFYPSPCSDWKFPGKEKQLTGYRRTKPTNVGKKNYKKTIFRTLLPHDFAVGNDQEGVLHKILVPGKMHAAYRQEEENVFGRVSGGREWVGTAVEEGIRTPRS